MAHFTAFHRNRFWLCPTSTEPADTFFGDANDTNHNDNCDKIGNADAGALTNKYAKPRYTDRCCHFASGGCAATPTGFIGEQ